MLLDLVGARKATRGNLKPLNWGISCAAVRPELSIRYCGGLYDTGLGPAVDDDDGVFMGTSLRSEKRPGRLGSLLMVR